MSRRRNRYATSARRRRAGLIARVRLRRLALATRRNPIDSTAVITVPATDDHAVEKNDEAAAQAGATIEPEDTQAESADQSAPADHDKQSGRRQRGSVGRAAVLFGIAALIAVIGLGAWLGYRTGETRESQQRHGLFLQAGRQAAVNLTSINYNDVDAELKRIIDSSTGIFRDDFRQRSPSFAEFVKQIKSISQGTVSEAGVESEHGDEAQVIVAVKVNTSTPTDGSQQPRYWRMRIGVQKVDNTAKVTNVEFVP